MAVVILTTCLTTTLTTQKSPQIRRSAAGVGALRSNMTAALSSDQDRPRPLPPLRPHVSDGALAANTSHQSAADEITRLRARPVIDVAHCVTLSGLSRSTVNRAIAAGELRSRKVGSRRLVEPRDLEAWLGVERSPDD